MNLFQLTMFFLLTAIVSFALNKLLAKWAIGKKIGALGGGRHLHEGFIPTLGGVAMLLSFYLGWGLWVWGTGNEGLLDTGFIGILAGMLLIHTTGLADDIRGISPLLKFVGAILSALIYIYFNPYITEISIPYFGSVKLGLLAPYFSILWIVGMVNALNLIDGIDGLAAGTGFIILGGLAYFAWVDHDFTSLTISIIFMASLAGFLGMNFPPAKMFMGDNGSLMLGFLLGVLPMRVVAFDNGYVSITVLITLLVLPFMDTAIAYIRRMLQGKSPFKPDKEHLHHRLLSLGLSKNQTMVFLWGLSLTFTLLAIKMYFSPEFESLVLFVLAFSVIAMGLRRLGYLERKRIYLPRWKLSSADQLIFTPFNMKKIVRKIIVLFFDICSVVVSFYLFLQLKVEVTTATAAQGTTLDDFLLVLLIVFWLILFYLNDLYQTTWDTSRVERLIRLFKATTFGVLILAFLSIDLTVLNTARVFNFFLYWFLLTAIVYFSRFILVTIERRYHILGFSDKNALIIGFNGPAKQIIKDGHSRSDLFLNIIGCVTDEPNDECLGTLKDLPALINKHQVEEIIFTHIHSSPEYVFDIVAATEGMGVNFKVTPHIYQMVAKAPPTAIGYPLFRLPFPRLSKWQILIKRLMDLLLSAAWIILGIIPVIIYSLFVRFRDKRVFFPEIVIGKYGKPFYLYKWNEENKNRSIADRLFFRLFFYKWTVFISVFIGKMSLVGPQLHNWIHVKNRVRAKPLYRRRFLLKPGLTGLAQMTDFYRGTRISSEEEIAFDIRYWEQLSLSVDLRILFNSFSLVVLRMIKGMGNG